MNITFGQKMKIRQLITDNSVQPDEVKKIKEMFEFENINNISFTKANEIIEYLEFAPILKVKQI